MREEQNKPFSLRTVAFYSVMLYIAIGCFGIMLVSNILQGTFGAGEPGTGWGAVGWYMGTVLPPAALALSIAAVIHIKYTGKISYFSRFSLAVTFVVLFLIVYLLYILISTELDTALVKIDGTGTLTGIVMCLIVLPIPLLATWSIGLSVAGCCALIPALGRLMNVTTYPDMVVSIILFAFSDFIFVFFSCLESYLIGCLGGKKRVVLGITTGIVDAVMIKSIINCISFQMLDPIKIDPTQFIVEIVLSVVLHILVRRSKEKNSAIETFESLP